MGAFSVYFDDGRWQEVRRTVGGCGLSGRKRRVGQEACWRSVVCRDKYGEWVKRPVGGVWSVGTSMASGSKELSTECGLSGQVCCVGQRNCRRGVVCRRKYGEWVKRPVAGMWSVGAKMLRGSKELSASVVCRVKFGEWVKRIVGGVWSVGAKSLRGSRGQSADVVCRGEKGEWVKRIVDGCGLSGRKGRVGQEACRWRLVCRRENGE